MSFLSFITNPCITFFDFFASSHSRINVEKLINHFGKIFALEFLGQKGTKNFYGKWKHDIIIT